MDDKRTGALAFFASVVTLVLAGVGGQCRTRQSSRGALMLAIMVLAMKSSWKSGSSYFFGGGNRGRTAMRVREGKGR